MVGPSWELTLASSFRGREEVLASGELLLRCSLPAWAQLELQGGGIVRNLGRRKGRGARSSLRAAPMAGVCETAEDFDRIMAEALAKRDAEALAKRDAMSSGPAVDALATATSSYLGSPPRPVSQRVSHRPSPPSGRQGSGTLLVSVFRLDGPLIATRSPYHEVWQESLRSWSFRAGPSATLLAEFRTSFLVPSASALTCWAVHCRR